MERSIDRQIDRYYESWQGINAVYDRWAARHGVTSNLLFVLDALRAGPCAQNEIVQRVQLTKQTVASIVDSMEKKGLAVRRIAETDHRSRVVALTETGAAYAEDLCAALRAFETRAMERLDAAQRDGLVENSMLLWKSMSETLENED